MIYEGARGNRNDGKEAFLFIFFLFSVPVFLWFRHKIPQHVRGCQAKKSRCLQPRKDLGGFLIFRD